MATASNELHRELGWNRGTSGRFRQQIGRVSAVLPIQGLTKTAAILWYSVVVMDSRMGACIERDGSARDSVLSVMLSVSESKRVLTDGQYRLDRPAQRSVKSFDFRQLVENTLKRE
jgi:hypothetical protein